MREILLSGWLFLAGGSCADDAGEKIRYLRVTPRGTVTECTFTLHRGETGWSIRSVTEAGKTRLSLSAQYDAEGRLTAAALTLSTADRKKTCKVEVADGKASVHREGKVSEFRIPPGVIVTSAPDWTDTFLLCRRYDRARGGKQAFIGLWIHPEKEPMRLTFTIERKGMDVVEHGSKKITLDRLEIRLRNNDGYAAWADDKGRMIKLQPLVAGAGYALVLDGFGKAADRLRVGAR
jgi:hypothetical protein